MSPLTNRLLLAFSSLGLVILVAWLMVVGRSLLIPFVIALIIWYLLLSLAQAICALPIVRGRWHVPHWLGLLLAFVLVFFALTGLGAIMTETARQFGSVELQARYNAQFLNLVEQLETALIYHPILPDGTINPNTPSWLHGLGLGDRLDFSSVRDFEAGNFMSQLVSRFLASVQNEGLGTLTSSATDVLRWASQLFGPIAGLVATATIITLYTAFLLVETSTFDQKLRALAGDAEVYKRWRSLFETIVRKINIYLRVKFFTSALTGILGYAVLKLFAIDFAEFWGLLLFLLNFIPIIGSFIATILPIFLALVQPGIGLSSVALVAFLLVGVQQGVGSVLEPRLMGTTLNLSPLVILVSLALFGSLWGIMGALLSVPLTSIITILLAGFESTRWVAVLLSRDGKVD